MKRSSSPRLARLFPFLTWLPGVDRSTLRADLLAGLTGAVIVLPQGVAYALIAGLPPQYGLYTAIVTAIVAGLFGSSRHLVSGPTAAISIVVFSVVSGVVSPDSPEFIPYVITLTLLTGLIQLALGLVRLGALVNFISHTVVIGFTAGAAVLIATSQLRHLFGVELPSGQAFIPSLIDVARALPETNVSVLAVGLATMGSALLIRRLRPRWPFMLLAMAVGGLFAWGIGGVERGVPMVGAMPAQLPPPSMPILSLEALRELAPGALAVAIIALIEAVSIARAVAMRSHQRIDGNQEFVGQGLSNVVGSFFSCYAGSGSFTRSGANYDAGARTPLAAVFASVILVGILLLAPGITRHLPMPAMAGIVLLIAWNLIDWHEIRDLLSISRGETAILGVTFASTLLLALEFAIYLGVLLSLVLYLKRTAQPPLVPLAPESVAGAPYAPGRLPDGQVQVLRLEGSLYFGAVDHVQWTLHQQTAEGYRHIVLVGQGVNFIDFAGAELLAREAARLRALGGGLYFCSFKSPSLSLLRKPRFTKMLKDAEFFESPKEAVKSIAKNINPSP
ncbi:SulP family inorganic anion transporter [Halomonas kalidii]|uniref:SulP family inorganic anion transporter n=1 Tax=Halomonas kalidii TaxID=3043293 RepID=A0ABT6VEW6_9GAMM|nr:SulP family inorganic anion transporter [Halomonas kalidii]MDI5932514.1 SulP family inorganic anion transporter [Halomonas kalidii]